VQDCSLYRFFEEQKNVQYAPINTNGDTGTNPPVPDASVTFDPNAASATTTFVGGMRVTTYRRI
jgi:hypothetical protein